MLMLLLCKAAVYKAGRANNAATPDEKEEPQCSVYPRR